MSILTIASHQWPRLKSVGRARDRRTGPVCGNPASDPREPTGVPDDRELSFTSAKPVSTHLTHVTAQIAPLLAHVGDGNFHLVYLVDPDDSAELEKARAHSDRMVMRALAMGGTCTGEHGVGYGKMGFLQAEHGEALALMRSIKVAFDPDNIMNPGKIFRL